MTDTVIRIEHLSKQYKLGLIGGRRLQEDVQRWWAQLRGKPDPLLKIGEENHGNCDGEYIWALRDVSFDVKPGEIVGIIGRNGAGKSTVLKILSRIMAPTAGRVKIKGRIASLLEVGTGFHPELTGRENIYLNGTILGMTKQDIKRKFDEIVAFSEIEQFIDTPVKRYSSGMNVRLAFAVAAHLEPEILVVDEVLAVGDIAFQKKCLGKMHDVSENEGRTVLFVSHNMQVVRALCQRGILLNQGRVVVNAPIMETIASYNEQLRKLEFNAETEVRNKQVRRGSGAVRFTTIKMQTQEGKDSQQFMMGDTIRFVLSFKVFKEVENLYVSVIFKSGKGSEIVTSVRHLISENRIHAGYNDTVIIEFPKVNLRPEEYLLYFWLGNNIPRPYDVVDNMLHPLVIQTNKTYDELGFRPTVPQGYFNIVSKLIRCK
jgi:lipopolysaccharide transport system ATP-binding protein